LFPEIPSVGSVGVSVAVGTDDLEGVGFLGSEKNVLEGYGVHLFFQQANEVVKEGVGQFDVIGLGVLSVVIKGGENPVGNGVRVFPIEGVVGMGVAGVGQSEMVENAVTLIDVKGNITKHVAFYVADETPQTLADGLFDEGLDDVMGLAGARSSDDLGLMPISA
jgi:hypothetical protein